MYPVIDKRLPLPDGLSITADDWLVDVPAHHFEGDYVDRDEWVADVARIHLTQTPAYRETDVHPDDIDGYEAAVHHLEGVVTEDDIRQRGPDYVTPDPIKAGPSTTDPLDVTRTGGTTGAPKIFKHHTHWAFLAEYSAEVHEIAGVPEGTEGLMMGPPGEPQGVGELSSYMAGTWSGPMAKAPMDPIFLKKLHTRDDLAFDPEPVLEYYQKHRAEEVEHHLRVQEIDLIFTSSNSLSSPVVRDLIHEYDVDWIVHGGTQLTPQDHYDFRTRYYEDQTLLGAYGSNLGTTIPQALPTPEFYDDADDGDVASLLERIEGAVDYVPIPPVNVFRIVDKEGNHELVDYGEEGYTKVDIFSPETMFVGLVEEDVATRKAGEGDYDHTDWVRNPHREEMTEADAEAPY